MQRTDCNLLILMSLLAIGSALLLLWNHIHGHFLDVNFLHRINANYSLLLYALLIVAGFALTKTMPRTSLILRSLGYLSLSCVLILLATSAIFTTPFPLQDSAFYHFDHLVGFHQGNFMYAIHQHAWLNRYLEICYYLLVQVALLVPIALAIMNDETAMYRYFLALIIATVMGYVIYYIWPTTNPVSQLHSPYFSAIQYQDFNQFIALHEHHRLAFYDSGIIGFPSFHVIWALLIVYGFWHYKIIREIAIVFTLSVMLATLSSGWHYLADIVGAFAVVLIAISLVPLLLPKTTRYAKCTSDQQDDQYKPRVRAF